MKVKTTSKTLSIDGHSVSSDQRNGIPLFPPNKSKSIKKAWIDSHEMWVAIIQNGEKRAITPIVIKSSLYWMDAVTGGIHWPVGMEVRRNANEATEILMAINSSSKQRSDDE